MHKRNWKLIEGNFVTNACHLILAPCVSLCAWFLFLTVFLLQSWSLDELPNLTDSNKRKWGWKFWKNGWGFLSHGKDKRWWEMSRDLHFCDFSDRFQLKMVQASPLLKLHDNRDLQFTTSSDYLHSSGIVQYTTFSCGILISIWGIRFDTPKHSFAPNTTRWFWTLPAEIVVVLLPTSSK